MRRLPLVVASAVGRATTPAADLVHRMDLRIPPSGRPEIVTIHDLPTLRFDDEGVMPRWALPSLGRTLGVICPSAFAASEVRDLAGFQRSWVIHNGVDRAFFEAAPLRQDELEQLGLRSPFVVHLGGATKRKNLAALAGAWQRISATHPGIQLLLCGPVDVRRTDLFSDLPNVLLTGRLDPPVVARLLRTAAAAVVPSLYEGFGLPALEGMAAGLPVVASARGALPEVCGDGALLVEPDAGSLAKGLEAVLGDDGLRRRLVHNGRARASHFTWEESARRHIEIYDELISGRR